MIPSQKGQRQYAHETFELLAFETTTPGMSRKSQCSFQRGVELTEGLGRQCPLTSLRITSANKIPAIQLMPWFCDST